MDSGAHHQITGDASKRQIGGDGRPVDFHVDRAELGTNWAKRIPPPVAEAPADDKALAGPALSVTQESKATLPSTNHADWMGGAIPRLLTAWGKDSWARVVGLDSSNGTSKALTDLCEGPVAGSVISWSTGNTFECLKGWAAGSIPRGRESFRNHPALLNPERLQAQCIVKIP